MAQQEKYQALKLERDGKDAEKDLLHLISQAFQNISCYAYKSRVKPETRLLEKLERKRAAKPDYTLQSITDVVGLRIVTLFRREMPDVVRQIASLINHDLPITPNAFERCCLKEVIIYSTNPSFDEIAHSIKEYFIEIGTEAQIKESREGYSSIHIVSSIGATNKVPVEIQVRTVFEDAWGEIDHKFGYVFRSGKENGLPIKGSRYVQDHLKILKKFSDACAEYADIIYEEATADTNPINTEGKVISVASDQEVLELFKEVGVPDKYIRSYVEGRSIRDSAISLLSTSQDEGQSRLIEAAGYFAELQEETDGNIPPIFEYYVRMNEALCLLSTGKADLLSVALKVYLELEEKNPGFAFLKFRIAQAYGRLGRTDRSIAKFEEAESVANAVMEKMSETKSWPMELPKADYDYMSQTLPKLLGYQLWVKAEQLKDKPEECAVLLKRAYEVTLPLLNVVGETRLHDIHNNLLYYAVQYLSLDESVWDAGFVAEKVLPQLDKSLECLEAQGVAGLSIEELDTLVRAYAFLNKAEYALSTAAKIIELAMAESSTEDSDQAARTLSMLTNALAIQAKYSK